MASCLSCRQKSEEKNKESNIYQTKTKTEAHDSLMC